MLAVNWPISFQRPEWLWLLVAIPVIVPASLHFLRGMERPRRYAAIALRCAVIAALAFALARIEWVRRSDRVAVMFVLDRSRSIPDELQLEAQKYVRQATQKAQRDDCVGVIGFDGRADVDVIPSRGAVDIMSFGLSGEPDRTDLAAGIRMAMATFPDGFARRIVLMSDGNENVGNLTEEIENAAANGVHVDIVPLQYRHDNEVMVDRIVVPSHTGQDSQIAVRTILKSQRPTRAKLSLYHNGQEVALANPIIELNGGMKPEPRTVPIELHSGGVHRFEARIAPMDERGDSIAENNQATAFTFVEAQGKVLLLTRARGDDDRVLVDALKREKIQVDVQTPETIQLDLLKLQEYSVVILANISADTFNTDQHRDLASYVRDFGGGLIMTGGDEAFGAGGWIGKPVEEVSPVNFEIKHKRQMPRGALAIIMHSCEAPDANYWGEQVAVSVLKTISSLDYLGVIAWSGMSGGVNWEVPLGLAQDKEKIANTIRRMQVGDMPDFDTTMKIAVRDLMKLKDASQRHMIIISDGDPSPPSQATIDDMKKNKITCSTVGIGYGAHVMVDRMMPIAKATGGEFYAVKNPRKVPQIFVKEARVVKRALIENRQFTPALTSSFDDVVSGLAGSQLPPLGGLVLTERKADAMVPIIRYGTDSGEKVEDPVLAYWNFEMGRMAVFTSGFWPTWGSDWSSWGNYGKFWAQVIRWAMHGDDTSAGSNGSSGGEGGAKRAASFDITTRLEGDRGKVVIEALNKDASYLNFLRISGKMVPPIGDTQPLYLAQTGPGRYEASFPINEHGNYLVSLNYSDPFGKDGIIKTGLSVPYSPEFREMGTNFGLLEMAAGKTNGRRLNMDPLKDQVFSRDLPPAVARQPMWRWIVTWILLPLFLLDVASRRLASTVAMSVYVEVAVFVMALAAMWKPGAPILAIFVAFILAEMVGWAVRWRSIGPALAWFTSSVRGLSRAGQRSAGALSQLKDARERVRENLSETAKPGEEKRTERPRTIKLEPVTDRSRKFDVGEAAADKPVKDLTESLGGAQAAGPESGESGRGSSAGSAGGGMADRLRRAKQRAADQIKEKKDEG